MKLQKIDKPTYQARRSRIQWTMVAALFALSLGFAELYRLLFVGGDSSLLLNALGVATGAGIVIFTLFKLRYTEYFHEVNYVWCLKQELNRIYRKSAKLDQALAEGTRDALIIKLFHVEGSRFIYDLDDNTLTMSELVKELDTLRDKAANMNPPVSVDDYDPSLLANL
jgi:hypothetical protein